MVEIQSSINLGICRLCMLHKELRNSHIIPEFLYHDLKNKNNQMVGINGVGAKNRKLIQKGLQEYILCDDCEQHFNDKFEKPFLKQWFELSPLPSAWSNNQIHQKNFDYTSFKLFHLSILFRASISSLLEFENVSLGKHEEIIRKMLLACDSGLPSTYPMFGEVVLDPKNMSVARIMTFPEKVKYQGHNCYGTIYGGVYWCICISSHRNLDIERVGLQSDGSMSFNGQPMNEVGIVQDMANVLVEGRVGKA